MRETAARERMNVDALVLRTLHAAVALPLPGLTVQERAARGNWEDFDRIMSRVHDVPPVPGGWAMNSERRNGDQKPNNEQTV